MLSTGTYNITTPPIPVCKDDVIAIMMTGSNITSTLYFLPYRAGTGASEEGFMPDNATIGLTASEELKVIDYVSKTYVDNKDLENVKITGDQSINGIKTFTLSPVVPTPSSNTQAVNKQYVDNALSGIPPADLSNLVDKDTAQTITGIKTFNALPISPVTPTASNQLVNKDYVDNALTPKANTSDVVTLTGNQSVAGVKTFSSSPIVPTPSANSEVANKEYVDTKTSTTGPSNMVTIDTAQEITGAKNFKTNGYFVVDSRLPTGMIDLTA